MEKETDWNGKGISVLSVSFYIKIYSKLYRYMNNFRVIIYEYSYFYK